MIIHGAGTNHWFHNDLINRRLILLVALTGNIGKNGGGFNHYVGQERIWPERGFKAYAFPEGAQEAAYAEHDAVDLPPLLQQRSPPLQRQAHRAVHRRDRIKNGWMPL